MTYREDVLATIEQLATQAARCRSRHACGSIIPRDEYPELADDLMHAASVIGDLLDELDRRDEPCSQAD